MSKPGGTCGRRYLPVQHCAPSGTRNCKELELLYFTINSGRKILEQIQKGRTDSAPVLLPGLAPAGLALLLVGLGLGVVAPVVLLILGLAPRVPPGHGFSEASVGSIRK